MPDFGYGRSIASRQCNFCCSGVFIPGSANKTMSNKNMNRAVLVGTGAVLLVAGYLTGRATHGNQSSGEVAGNLPRDTKKVRSDGRDASSSTESRKPRSISEIMAIPGQAARMQALSEFYAGLDADQLRTEAGKLSQLPMNQRLMASLLLFGRWGEIDPLGALAQTNKLGMAGNLARSSVLQSWASTDPANAAKYFAENPREFAQMGMGPMGGGSGASVIAAEWAKLDPDAAMAWANTLTNANDKTAAFASVVREIAATNPSKAAEIAATLTGEDQTQAYKEIAGKWGASDFTAAKAWIDTLPAAARDQALASALSSYASTDPAGAAGQVAAMAAGESKSRAIANVAEAWAATDPAAAAAWVAQQEGNSNGAIQSVMMNWASQDSAAALSFINQQPQGELRDDAISSYVMANRTADPQESVKLAETISDERDRDRTVGMSAMRWMQEDETAAKEYIENSTTLSERAKGMILSGGGPFGGRLGGRSGP